MNTLGYQAVPIFNKKKGIAYIKSHFIIDLGSIKCYLGTIITNLQLFNIMIH